MSKIETIGTYLGTIVESGYNETKSGLPQWVARIKVDKKYVEDKAEIEHFTAEKALQGAAGYVDYSGFDQSIGAYLVLFSTKNDKPTLNAEQLFKATGWAFPAFDALDQLVGKPVLFQVREKKGYTDATGQYHDQTGELEVSWIDSPDASPERQLKTLDAAAVKAAMNQYRQFAPKPAARAASFPTAPAAAASSAVKPSFLAPASPATVRPVASNASAITSGQPTSPATPVATPRPVATPAASAAVPASATKTPPKAKVKPNTAPQTGTAECSQLDAWNYVNANKGSADDDTVAEEWSKITAQVLGDLSEDAATPAHWAQVRGQVTARLLALIPA